MVIVGTVIDDAMGDRLRVTMVATGLGGAVAQVKRPPKLEVLENVVVAQRTGTDGIGVQIERIDYDNLDQPAVIRRAPRGGGALPSTAIDASEIPAFLRKQAD
jgi:cell division protein FtsZ